MFTLRTVKEGMTDKQKEIVKAIFQIVFGVVLLMLLVHWGWW